MNTECCGAWYQASDGPEHICDLPKYHTGRHAEHFPNGTVFTWFRTEDLAR